MNFKHRGFTLSELLLAAAILAVVLTSLLAIFINCLFLNDANRNRSIAMGHAQYVMEDIKSYTSGITRIGMLDTQIKSGYWNWTTSAINATYGLRPLRNETITTTSSGTNPLNVNVTVTWKSLGQTTSNRNESLETLFTRQ